MEAGTGAGGLMLICIRLTAASVESQPFGLVVEFAGQGFSRSGYTG